MASDDNLRRLVAQIHEAMNRLSKAEDEMKRLESECQQLDGRVAEAGVQMRAMQADIDLGLRKLKSMLDPSDDGGA